jgi:hypothetical protein
MFDGLDMVSVSTAAGLTYSAYDYGQEDLGDQPRK